MSNMTIEAVKDEYSDLMNDPRWKACAGEIKALDGFRCILCGCTTGLQVHHLRYGSKRLKMAPWDYPEPFLITLCADHHATIHEPTRLLQAENILISVMRRRKLNPIEVLEMVGVVARHKTQFDEAIETRNEAIRKSAADSNT